MTSFIFFSSLGFSWCNLLPSLQGEDVVQLEDDGDGDGDAVDGKKGKDEDDDGDEDGDGEV